MPTKTRINGKNYTQLPRLVSDEIILAGLPQTAGYPTGYGDLAAAITSGLNIVSGVVSVLDYGAVADGLTDSTVSIQAALDSDANTVVFPAGDKYYICSNLSIPAGKTLIGIGRVRPYAVASYADFDGTCAIVLKTASGSDALISLQGAGCSFYGINFVGNLDRSKPLFSAGSVESTAYFEYCGAYYFSFGFGKNGGYIRNSRFFNCHSHNNGVGFYNLIDSHVFMCEINANILDGIQMQTGSGDTAFVGNKVEWNQRYNWNIFQANNITINGGVCDRSYDHGMRIVQSLVSVTGVMLRRNGRNGGKAHILHENNTSLIVSGCNSAVGVDDDGSGTNSPDYFATGTGAATGQNLISSCNVGGNILGVSSGVQSTIFYRECRGNPDTPMPIMLKATTVVTASSDTTSVTGTWLQSVAATSAATNKARVCVLFRNATSGLIASQEFVVQLARSGGGSGAASIISTQQVGSTTINNTGANLNVTFVNVAADCTSFDVVCSNTTANSLQIRVQVFQAQQV